MNKCVFLDRDGVINREIGDYVYKTENFEILKGVPETLLKLKKAGFLLVVVTNQGGISKGLYSKSEVLKCHEILQTACGNLIDELYYSPYHPSVTESLSRKPDSLMLEKAVAKFNINSNESWLVGDHKRDIAAAQRLGIKTIRIIPSDQLEPSSADFSFANLSAASKRILNQ